VRTSSAGAKGKAKKAVVSAKAKGKGKKAGFLAKVRYYMGVPKKTYVDEHGRYHRTHGGYLSDNQAKYRRVVPKK
jgi:hypothetical protein